MFSLENIDDLDSLPDCFLFCLIKTGILDFVSEDNEDEEHVLDTFLAFVESKPRDEDFPSLKTDDIDLVW